MKEDTNVFEGSKTSTPETREKNMASSCFTKLMQLSIVKSINHLWNARV